MYYRVIIEKAACYWYNGIKLKTQHKVTHDTWVLIKKPEVHTGKETASSSNEAGQSGQ